MTEHIENLEELEALERAATPGPWVPEAWIETDGNSWRACGPSCDPIEDDDHGEPGCDAEQQAQRDAAFIAALRNAAPSLLASAKRVKRLEAALREASDIIANHGCDCECDHAYDEHGDDCERCSMCLLAKALFEEFDVYNTGGDVSSCIREIKMRLSEMTTANATAERERDEAYALLEQAKLQEQSWLDKAWEATGVASTVRGLTTLDDVISVQRGNIMTALRERDEARAALRLCVEAFDDPTMLRESMQSRALDAAIAATLDAKPEVGK